MAGPPASTMMAGGMQFPATLWSVVMSAGETASPESHQALSALCRAYWFPLYAFVRRQGHSPHDAQDLTQSFFVHLLDRQRLARVRREKGRFRSYLLASLRNFLADERDKAATKKRGGDIAIISLDAHTAEERYHLGPPDGHDPEKLFERRWALTVLDRVLERLEAEYVNVGKTDRFTALQPFLLGDDAATDYAEVGRRLGMSAGAPASGDSLIFPSGPAQLSSSNPLGSPSLFNSITFTGPDYQLQSTLALTVSNGITHRAFLGTDTFNASLVLGANQSWLVTNRGVLVLNGNVNLSDRTLTFLDSGTVEANGNFFGSGALIETNSGRLILNGSNSITAPVTVGDGRLTVDGSLQAGAFSVTTGATLDGNGEVSDVTINGGTLAPNTTTAPGILTVNGNLTLSNGGVFDLDLNGPGAGTGHDQLVVLGTVNISGATLNRTLGFAPSGGETLMILDNRGSSAVTGTFAGLPNNATFTLGTTTFRIVYNGGDGHDIVLFNPAPSTAPTPRFWTGAGAGGFWLTPQNWSNNVLPSVGDNLVFPPGAARQLNTNNYPVDSPFTIEFSGSNYTLRGTQRLGIAPGGILFSNTAGVANGTNTLAATVKFTAINDTPSFIDVAGSSRTLDARAATFVIGPDAPVVKRGAGTLLLGAGASINWMSPLTISNGAVSFETLFSTFPVTLANGTVTGPGGTGPLTQNGGLLLPGVAGGSGSLTVNGDANLNEGGVQFHLTGAIPGSGFGQLRVNGAVNLAGATLTVTLGFTPAAGTEFVLIANDDTDAIAGAGFGGRPEGSVFTVGGTAFAVNHHGGDGNDFSLTAVVPPAGASKIWDGGGTTGFWSNRFNWVGDAAPLAGMDLIFTNAPRSNATNDYPAGTSFNSIRLIGSMPFNLLGSSVVLTGGITNQSSQNQLVDVPVTLAGSQVWPDVWRHRKDRARHVRLDRRLGAECHVLPCAGRDNGAGANQRDAADLGHPRCPRCRNGCGNSSSRTAGGQRRGQRGRRCRSPGVNRRTAVRLPGHVAQWQHAGLGTNGPLSLQGNLITTGNGSPNVVRVSIAGGAHDRLRIASSVSLQNTFLDLSGASGLPAGGQITVLNKIGVGAINGTFANAPEGALLANGGEFFQIIDTGGDGNDVVLTTVTPPRVSEIVSLPDGARQLNVTQAPPGSLLILEATPILLTPPNLIPWLPIQTNSANNLGNVLFLDSAATNFPQRF